MPRIEETEMIARKILPIIYSIDVSGSMGGEKIASVNEAMKETKQILQEVSNDNPDAEIRVAVQTFSSGAKWITKTLEKIENYYWNSIQANGVTDLGAALKGINAKLSKTEFLSGDIGFNLPVIIFMSDGGPADDWEKQLDKAKQNAYFKKATKIAIAIGDDADTPVLGKLVGNIEAVIKVNDANALKNLIRVVSQTASITGSKVQSGNSEGNSTGADIVKDVASQVEDAETFDDSAWD